jgi:photosystem II stability/assembly factor-like uncharacterized protein
LHCKFKKSIMQKILLFLFLLLSNFLFAQNANYLPNLNPSDIPPQTADMPEWAKLMYAEQPNVFAVEKAYADFYKDKIFKKDNYTRYYKRWRLAVDGNFDAKGNVFMQPNIGVLPIENQADKTESTERNAAGNWTLLGPKETIWLKDDNSAQPQAPWQTNIYSFDVAPSNPNILYAGIETAAVFKSTNKGTTWTSVSDNRLFKSSVLAIAIHPTDPNIVYASSDNDIQKTTDGGATWTTIYSYSNLDANDIAISPTDPNIILLASDQGYFRSTNGGANFTRLLTSACYDIEFKTDDATVVYILLKKTGTTSFSELHKSTDSGATFTVKNTGWINKQEGEGRLTVTPANSNYIYAVLLTENNTPAVMKTTDGGENWAEVGHGSMDNGQGYYDLSIAASPSNAEHLIIASTTAYKTTDGGTTYTAVGGYAGPFNIHPDIQEIRAVGGDTWIATDGGMNYSSDFFTSTSNWSPRSKGLSAVHFWGFSQGWHEDMVAGGRYHNGNTVMHENYPAGLSLRMGGAEQGTGYIMLGRPRHVKYSDLGDGWIVPPTAYSNSSGRFTFSKPPNEDGYGYNAGEVEFDPRCYKHIYVTEGNSLWKSTDGGVSFTSLHTFAAKAHRFEVSRQNPDVIYVQTAGGIFKSTNGGTAFTAVNTSMISNWYRVQIALNPLNDSELWITCPDCSSSNKVFKSTDSGANWTNLTTSAISGYRTVNLAYQIGSNGGIYVGCDKRASTSLPSKVFYRDNSMSNWVDFSTNFPQSADFLKTIPFYRDGKIRVATDQGIWESPFNTANAATVHVQPTVDKLATSCARDTFYFDDYSVAQGAAAYNWTFSPAPQYVSSTTNRSPKVYFGASGTYTAALTVNGVAATTPLTITVGNACNVDTIPGNTLSLDGTAYTYAVQEKAMNLNSNTVTISAWIKRNGTQEDVAGIFMCRGTTTTAGLNIRANNQLMYHWNDTRYSINTGLVVPDNTWTHVALVATPTNVKIYMNGKVYTDTWTVPAEAFDAPLRIGTDRAYDRNFKGNIDEVTVFNYALSQNEIRELMHLTKNPTQQTGLVAYYQFNETTGVVLDRIGNNHISFASSGATRSTSTAPVGKGVSNRQTVTAGGTFNFGATGVTMKFPATGTKPNGELCVTRINQAPETKANAGAANLYFIVNNFGTNATFAALDSIAFNNVGLSTTGTLPTSYKLFKRSSFDEGATWGNAVATANGLLLNSNGNVGFGVGNNVTSFSQFQAAYIGTPLSVDWLSFTPQVLDKKVNVQWRVFQQNTSHFILEKSKNGVDFQSLTRENAKSGDGEFSYSYVDENPFVGTNYYRITEVAKDGRKNKSVIKVILINALADVAMIYPNPSTEGQRINIKTTLSDVYTLKIYNVEGKEVFKSQFLGEQNELPTPFAKGMYFYEIKSDTYKGNGKFVVE